MHPRVLNLEMLFNLMKSCELSINVGIIINGEQD